MKKGICDCGAEVSGKSFYVCLKINGKMRDKVYYSLCPSCRKKVVVNAVKKKQTHKEL